MVSDLRLRHFAGGVVLWAVRWYSRYGISYRNSGLMMVERRVNVGHRQSVIELNGTPRDGNLDFSQTYIYLDIRKKPSNNA